MLIREFAIVVMQCRACDASLPANRKSDAPCPYCGAASAEAKEVGAFSHDVRVLVCDSCAAPMPVPVRGGHVTCSYCDTSFEITARREMSLGREGTAGDIDEAARLVRLRKQDTGAVFPPAIVRPLMKKGGVHDDSAEQATTMWRAARLEVATLRNGSAPQPEPLAAVEKRLYYLTELLADYHNSADRPLVARAFLEASLERLSDPLYVQPIYCWLARNAGRSGDYAAADAWLDLCDKRPEDLGMDSAVRFAWASISIFRDDFEGVLMILGRSPAEVPLSNKYDKVAVLHRAHAIEKLEGAEAAADHLVRWTPSHPHAWSFTLTMLQANLPRLSLCRESIGIAVRRTWRWRTPAIVIAVFLFGLAAMVADTFFGDRVLKGGIYPVGILWILLVGSTGYITFDQRVKMRRALRDLERLHSSNNGCAESPPPS